MREDGHMNHVTVVTQRAGRRIMDRNGQRKQLCNATELTAYDLLFSEASAALRKGTLDKWLSCESCKAIVKKGA